MTELQYVSENNPIHGVREDVYQGLVSAQHTDFTAEFHTAEELIERVLLDLHLSIEIPEGYSEISALQFADAPFKELVLKYRDLLYLNNLPPDSIVNHSEALAQRTHLIRAFSDPDEAVRFVISKVTDIVNRFPRTMSEIQCGRNRGDVLDPYIIAATQFLLYNGNFERAMGGIVAHKALMMIEDLLGHLHEDVIGRMRGNYRVPEPRGDEQETLDLNLNPFPGADVIQVPLNQEDKISFHQIKSKTGSAKGGDGRRLGLQLAQLRQKYDGDIYYHALIGNTLRGHRSKTAVEREASDVVVLVGSASFRQLTRTPIGADLLLRVYQAAFKEVQAELGYDVDTMAYGIAESFSETAEEHGEAFLDYLLHNTIGGELMEQDSRLFNLNRNRRNNALTDPTIQTNLL